LDVVDVSKSKVRGYQGLEAQQNLVEESVLMLLSV
jgi:hypothetical protein